MQASDQNILAFGRNVHLFEQSGIADRRDSTVPGVNAHKLGGGVVFEQIFVMRILQHVLIRWNGARMAIAFLHARSCGHRGFRGRRMPTRRYSFHQQRPIVGKPVDGIA